MSPRHTFGFEFYSPPKNERRLFQPRAHKLSKDKREAFTDSVSNSKAWIPPA